MSRFDRTHKVAKGDYLIGGDFPATRYGRQAIPDQRPVVKDEIIFGGGGPAHTVPAPDPRLALLQKQNKAFIEIGRRLDLAQQKMQAAVAAVKRR